MKLLHFLLLFGLAAATVPADAQPRTQSAGRPVTIAHRGCWSGGIPENSIAGVIMARRYGYAGIECDARYTADSVVVVMHDATINRTVRRAADYSRIDKPLYLSQLTFEQLRRDYVLESDDPSQRVPVPTLEELLLECRKQGVIPMIHSDLPEAYRTAKRIMGDGWIAFSGYEQVLKARAVSDCMIMLGVNGGDAETAVKRLTDIGGRCGVSTMNRALLTEDYCRTLREAGFEVQASIFPAPDEVKAQRNGITYQLSDFCIAPDSSVRPRDRFRKRNVRLPDTRIIEKEWADVAGHGGITLEIRFRGTVEVALCGRRYTLTRESEGVDCISTRIVRGRPSLRIEAKGDAEIGLIDSRVYEF